MLRDADTFFSSSKHVKYLSEMTGSLNGHTGDREFAASALFLLFIFFFSHRIDTLYSRGCGHFLTLFDVLRSLARLMSLKF